jgi:hypothetical protein
MDDLVTAAQAEGTATVGQHFVWLEIASDGWAQEPGRNSSPTLVVNAVSQLGVLLFMFLVGLELDLGSLRGRRYAVTLTTTPASRYRSGSAPPWPSFYIRGSPMMG